MMAEKDITQKEELDSIFDVADQPDFGVEVITKALESLATVSGVQECVVLFLELS